MISPVRTVAAAVAVADAVLAGAGARRARWLTKPAIVPAIAAGARSSGPLAVALTASWIGDVALLSESDAGLLGGITGFAVAHAAYLTAIRSRSGAGRPAGGGRRSAGPRPGLPAGGVPGVEAVVGGAVWLAAGHMLWRKAGPVRVPVLGYAALVTAMGAAAVRAGRRTGDARLAAGGALFVVSDGLVAASLFGPKRRSVDAAVMITYAAAQMLLTDALEDR